MMTSLEMRQIARQERDCTAQFNGGRRLPGVHSTEPDICNFREY